jgi:hypothetical protein
MKEGWYCFVGMRDCLRGWVFEAVIAVVEELVTGIEESVERDLGQNRSGHRRRSERRSGRGIVAGVVLE